MQYIKQMPNRLKINYKINSDVVFVLLKLQLFNIKNDANF